MFLGPNTESILRVMVVLFWTALPPADPADEYRGG